MTDESKIDVITECRRERYRQWLETLSCEELVAHFFYVRYKRNINVTKTLIELIIDEDYEMEEFPDE